MQVARGDAIVLHHHALDGIDDDLVFHALWVMRLNHFIQMDGRNGKNQHITGIDDLLHVVGNRKLIGIKSDALDVMRIAAKFHQMFPGFLPSYPPTQVLFVGEHHLGNGRGPGAASNKSVTQV